jgi:hypothetical protein
VKCPLFLSDFNQTLIFSVDFQKILKLPEFIKICPVGAKFLNADRRTDMTKLIVTFRNFVNVPKNQFIVFFPNCLLKDIYETVVFQFIYKV